MIKHGSMMINAVSNSTVPHISVLIGASYGAGHYGMCGRAYDPRFLFAWPSAKSAVMGGAQLAGVLSIVNRADTPLLFLQNTTGYMVGASYEQAGIIKHGSMMINAVSNSTVPHISLLIGASYGAGHYGMCGRAYDPRFLFAWPSAKSAVMGGAQLSGVLSIVARAAAEARGQQVDEEADAAMRAAVEGQIEAESLPMVLSGMLYDDGVIDPRDTRTVLGMCLSAIANGPIKGTSNFGVFRM